MSKSMRVNIMTTDEIMKDGKALADAQGISFSELVNQLLQLHIKRNEKQLHAYYENQNKIKME